MPITTPHIQHISSNHLSGNILPPLWMLMDAESPVIDDLEIALLKVLAIIGASRDEITIGTSAFNTLAPQRITEIFEHGIELASECNDSCQRIELQKIFVALAENPNIEPQLIRSVINNSINWYDHWTLSNDHLPFWHNERLSALLNNPVMPLLGLEHPEIAELFAKTNPHLAVSHPNTPTAILVHLINDDDWETRSKAREHKKMVSRIAVSSKDPSSNEERISQLKDALWDYFDTLCSSDKHGWQGSLYYQTLKFLGCLLAVYLIGDCNLEELQAALKKRNIKLEPLEALLICAKNGLFEIGDLEDIFKLQGWPSVMARLLLSCAQNRRIKRQFGNSNIQLLNDLITENELSVTVQNTITKDCYHVYECPFDGRIFDYNLYDKDPLAHFALEIELSFKKPEHSVLLGFLLDVTGQKKLENRELFWSPKREAHCADFLFNFVHSTTHADIDLFKRMRDTFSSLLDEIDYYALPENDRINIAKTVSRQASTFLELSIT